MTLVTPLPLHAGLVTRTIAIVLDALLLAAGLAIGGGVVALVLSLFPGGSDRDLAAVLGAAAVWTAIVTGYFTGCWVLTGSTIGMRVMGIRVLGPGGRSIGPGRALVRLAGMVLAAIPCFAGYLLVLVDDRRRGLHDLLAGTVVVHAPRAR